MRSTSLLCQLLIAVCLSACSKSSEPPPPEPPRLQPDQTVFKDQVRALEKAKTVDQTIQQDAQHTRDAIEQQEAPAR